MKACKIVGVAMVAVGGLWQVPFEAAGNEGRECRYQTRVIQQSRPESIRIRPLPAVAERRGRVVYRQSTYRTPVAARRYHTEPVRVRYVPRLSPYQARIPVANFAPAQRVGDQGPIIGTTYLVDTPPQAVAEVLPPVAGSLETEIQLALRRLGYYRGPIDGVIGQGTLNAVCNFRADAGLPVENGIDGAFLRALGLR